MNFKKLFAKVNWVYAIILIAFSLYLVNKEGWEAYLNYVLFFLALFVPIFAFVQSFKIIRQIIVKDNIAKSDIYILITLVIAALVTYFVGLDKAQRIVLIVIDVIVCFFIILIMLYTSRKKKT
jgi:hypothetical protein